MELDTLLTQLETAQLVRRADNAELEYLFKHTLTQETAYESLLKQDRKRLHRQVGEALERLYAERLGEYAERLADHFWKGQDWAKAAEYALRAGERAMREYALREALEQYDRALQALDESQGTPEQIIDATLGWIRPALSLRPYDDLLARLARVEKTARERQDKRRLAQILHWVADVHFAHGYNTRAVPALFENYRLATEVGDEQLSVVPSYWMAFFMVDRDPRGALAQFEKVVELARKHHNREIEAHAIATQAFPRAARRICPSPRRATASARNYSEYQFSHQTSRRQYAHRSCLFGHG